MLAASVILEDAPPVLLMVLVVGAWMLPLPCAVAGWWVLADLPAARRRYRTTAVAVVSAYAAVVASGATVALTVGRDSPALGVGACCLTLAGPLVGMLLLIQPSALRAGNAPLEELPDPDGDPPTAP
jgi:hypothetical protein